MFVVVFCPSTAHTHAEPAPYGTDMLCGMFESAHWVSALVSSQAFGPLLSFTEPTPQVLCGVSQVYNGASVLFFYIHFLKRF